LNIGAWNLFCALPACRRGRDLEFGALLEIRNYHPWGDPPSSNLDFPFCELAEKLEIYFSPYFLKDTLTPITPPRGLPIFSKASWVKSTILSST
jgi:hypothetical protein